MRRGYEEIRRTKSMNDKGSKQPWMLWIGLFLHFFSQHLIVCHLVSQYPHSSSTVVNERHSFFLAVNIM